MKEVTILGKLPDPFLKKDGTKVTPEEWKSYRKELLEKTVHLAYGGMPPRPEEVKIEPLNDTARSLAGRWYKIYAGKKEHKVSFLLELLVPFVPGKAKTPYDPFGEGEKYPVLLTGDACYMNCESDTVGEARRRGYIVARFNRLELASDLKDKGRVGGLYDIYPENTEFTAISAWAWGYSVCMDVFERLSFTDETEVGITGHSRGGKTVLLAAATDERIKYVCPNNSGLHGCAPYRYMVLDTETGKRTETLSDMLSAFPHWMGKGLWDYEGRENELPYDANFFGTFVAPRYYLQCEGMQDYWINPQGSYQSFMAVKKAFDYLGCFEHAGAWFRPGEHRHKLPDFTQFLDFMDRARKGLPVAEHLKMNPYPCDEAIY